MKIVDQDQGLSPEPAMASAAMPKSRGPEPLSPLPQASLSDSSRGEKRTSPDPLSRTDRYRLVTPFKPQL